MANHNDLGVQGEQLAINFLHQAGLEILESNWRHKKAEIDIIAKDGNILVFVEVKTRSTDYFGNPEDFVSLKKQLRLADAAMVYLEKMNHDGEFRFDIVSIVKSPGGEQRLEHLEDAFFPSSL